MERVDPLELERETLAYYYRTYRAYYGWVADYTTNDAEKVKYLKKTDAYRDSILIATDPCVDRSIVWAEKRKNNFDMEQVKLTCQVCENHCALEAEVEDGEVMDVMGNRCLKGFSYAQRAVTELMEEEQ